MIKICVTGPESSGKTTLASQLATHFGATLVPEFSRHYLEENGPDYSEGDLLTIAKGQLDAEQSSQGEMVICDTGIEVIQIWSMWKYGRCDAWIEEQVQRMDYNLYLLCKPDLPWEDDRLRENRLDRDDLFKAYEKLLSGFEIPVFIVEGLNEQRLENALSAIIQATKKDRH